MIVMDTEIQSKQGKSQKEKPIKQEKKTFFIPIYSFDVQSPPRVGDRLCEPRGGLLAPPP